MSRSRQRTFRHNDRAATDLGPIACEVCADIGLPAAAVAEVDLWKNWATCKTAWLCEAHLAGLRYWIADKPDRALTVRGLVDGEVSDDVAP